MNKQLMQLLQNNANAAAKQPLRVSADATEAHIYVMDVIDSFWGASAKAMIEAMAGQEGKTIYLHINSPGGDVFEARAMTAAIAGHKGKVIALIEGVCASAATYLALAASEVRMLEGSLFMVHNSWTFAYGNKTELRATADLLDKIDGTIQSDYLRKTGASAEQVAAWMDNTTWFTAQEALDAKFIDAIDSNTKSDNTANAAAWDLSAYPNAPKQQSQPPKTPKEPEPNLTALAANQMQINRNRLRLLTPI